MDAYGDDPATGATFVSRARLMSGSTDYTDIPILFIAAQEHKERKGDKDFLPQRTCLRRSRGRQAQMDADGDREVLGSWLLVLGWETVRQCVSSSVRRGHASLDWRFEMADFRSIIVALAGLDDPRPTNWIRPEKAQRTQKGTRIFNRRWRR